MTAIVEKDIFAVPAFPERQMLDPDGPAVRDAALQISHVPAERKAPVPLAGVVLVAPRLPEQQSPDGAQREQLEQALGSAQQNIRQMGLMLAGLNLSGLTSPDSFAVEFAAQMQNLSSVQKKNQLEEIERARQQNLHTMAINVEKINEALEAAKEAQKSGLAAKIFGWISAIASIAVGAIMVATGIGAAVGALMIAGGVVGVANMAVQQMAKDGLISPKVMEKLGPILMAVEIAIAVVAAVVTFGGAAAGAIAKMAGKAAEVAARMGSKTAQMVAKVVSETMAGMGSKMAGIAGDVLSKSGMHGVKYGVQISDTVMNVGTGVTQSVASGLEAKAADRNADVKESRAEIAALQMVMDRIRDVLRQIVESGAQTLEQVLQMMHAQDASLHNLSSRPTTI